MIFIVWTIAIMVFATSLDRGIFDPFSLFNLFLLFALPWSLKEPYITLCQVFNRTRLIISEHKIIVETKPLPVYKARREFYAADIEQVYVKRQVAYLSRGSTRIDYHVYVLKHGQETAEELVHRLSYVDHALFLEQEIEHYLGIVDRPVEGEYWGKVISYKP